MGIESIYFQNLYITEGDSFITSKHIFCNLSSLDTRQNEGDMGHSIFVDEPEKNEEKIALGFKNYATNIVDLILNSSAQFTIGIFGDWGTGKSTLLENIQSKLENKKISCERFNAWRYESEDRLATIPLMTVIINALIDKAGNNESLKDRATRFIKAWSVGFNIGIANAKMDFSKMDEKEKNLEKPSLQEGLDTIKDLMKSSHASTEQGLHLVVLIDDLDRCTPEKTVEVLESIKLFFDHKGIVFVLGLNKDIVEAAIDSKYSHFGKKYSGNDYLKKIIQVPFPIPPWKGGEVKTYVTSLLKEHSDSKYKEIFESNIKIIAQVVEPNPREVKRFLNNFILANQIYGIDNKLIRQNELLALQGLLLRWPWFYNAIMDDIDIRDSIKELTKVDLTEEQKNKIKEGSVKKRVLEEKKLLEFLSKQGRIIFRISKPAWKDYRRAGALAAVDSEESIKDLIEQKQKLEEELSKLEWELKIRTQLKDLKQNMPHLSDEDIIRKINEVKRAIYTIQNTIKQRENS